MSEWVKWVPVGGGRPAELDPGDLVEFMLAGEGGIVRRSVAGALNWGPGVGPNGEGRVSQYRLYAPAAPEYRPEAPVPPVAPRLHSHYFKSVAGLTEVDVYRVLDLFGVTDPALGHAIKKLMVAGGRGAGKDVRRDVREAIDTLMRWQEMRAEDQARSGVPD